MTAQIMMSLTETKNDYEGNQFVTDNKELVLHVARYGVFSHVQLFGIL